MDGIPELNELLCGEGTESAAAEGYAALGHQFFGVDGILAKDNIRYTIIGDLLLDVGQFNAMGGSRLKRRQRICIVGPTKETVVAKLFAVRAYCPHRERQLVHILNCCPQW